MFKYIIILLVIVGFYSCQEDSLLLYESGNYLNFDKNSDRDSLEVSFFFHPGQESIQVPVGLEIVGNILETDTEFNLAFDAENSTATEDDFELPEILKFKAGEVRDTINLTLNKSEKLNDSIYKLVLKIVPNSNFKKGITERSILKVYFTSQVSQPTWWDDDIESVYLGEFSAEKYNLFFEVTGQSDLTNMHLSMVRQHALKFKRYLAENPTYEKDGRLMTVTVIG